MTNRCYLAKAACYAALAAILLACHDATPAWGERPKDALAPEVRHNDAASDAEAMADADLLAGASEDDPEMFFDHPMLLGMEDELLELPDEASPESEADLAGPIQSEPIQTGFVILEGRYIPPPYTIQWTEKGLHVNDLPVPFEHRSWMARPAGRSRRPWRLIASLEHQLRSNALLLGTDAETAIVMPPRDAVTIVETLVSDQPTEAKIETLVTTGHSQFSSGQWSNVLKHFEPTEELLTRMATVKEMLKANRIEASTITTSKAIGASVLTTLSIALTVFALGTLLGHRPNARQGWRGCNPSRSGCRLVVRCVVLLVLLNAFDLACTLLAVQSGGFWELNPVAERLVNSVGHMILFKATLIAAGAAILLAFRQYRFTQHAAWWVCVFHMVLILRWATYNSLFLT